jgi:hypothetical protein
MKTYISLAVLVLLSSWSARADEDEGFSVSGLNKTAAHTCTDGEKVSIDGIGHTVTLTGPCRVIEVSGQRNVVTTDLVESVGITGQQNSVTWKSALDPKKKVKASVTGLGNKAGPEKKK